MLMTMLPGGGVLCAAGRLKVIAAEPEIDFTDAGYQSQLADHQRSTALQSIRNNLKATELQLCDSIATKRQLVG